MDEQSSARHALVRALRQLAGSAPNSDERRLVGLAVGRLIAQLAAGPDRDSLSTFLTLDPTWPDPIWSVVCYESGSFTGDLVTDFMDPAEAACAMVTWATDRSRLAELVVSDRGGLRWTALSASGAAVTFQAPDQESVTDGTARGGGSRRDEALARWARELDLSLDHHDEPPLDRSGPSEVIELRAVPTVPASPIAGDGIADLARGHAELVERLLDITLFAESLGDTIRRLEAQLADTRAPVRAAAPRRLRKRARVTPRSA